MTTCECSPSLKLERGGTCSQRRFERRTYLQIRSRLDHGSKGSQQAVLVPLSRMSMLWSWPNDLRLTNQWRRYLLHQQRPRGLGQLQAACFASSPGRLEHQSSVRQLDRSQGIVDSRYEPRPGGGGKSLSRRNCVWWGLMARLERVM